MIITFFVVLLLLLIGLYVDFIEEVMSQFIKYIKNKWLQHNNK